MLFASFVKNAPERVGFRNGRMNAEMSPKIRTADRRFVNAEAHLARPRRSAIG
jgi:hypothetical protein